MCSKVVIFGTNQLAELAEYYIRNDTNLEVEAFTVHKKFKNCDIFKDKPVVDFEDIEKNYPPSEYFLFAPLSGKNLNKIRESVYNEGKIKGYKFYTYLSSKATILTEKIGENCFILEDNTIQPYVEIGNNCVLWSGNHIGHHSKIEDHVFITSHCVISGNCIIKSHSWLGVNCTLRDGLIIENGTLIAMSASVTKNTVAFTVYMGVPAKPKGKSDIEKVAMSL
uniref:Hexapeptide repeat-containing transferase n=1 Tax=viral metagenome TaxID=1070528 RepID=A0A6C0M023_9ZZZZ